MFDNKYIAERLLFLGKLLEVSGDATLHVLACSHGVRALRGLEQPIGDLLRAGDMPFDLKEDTAFLERVVLELETTGTAEILDSLLEVVPQGVVRMLELNGLGPKKARVIWQKMGIDNLGELYYACEENRLVGEKGFGQKTQEKISAAIEYIRLNGKRFLYAEVFPHAARIQKELVLAFGPEALIELTGEVRRKAPVIGKIEFLVEPSLYKDLMLFLIRSPQYEMTTAGTDLLQVAVRGTAILADFHFKGVNFYLDLFQTTGSLRHVAMVPVEEGYFYRSEAEIYERANLQYVRPELREGREEVLMADRGEIPQLLEVEDLKGVLHVHSDWSDGLHSIEELALAARELGMEYIGITDHSKAAHHANGLDEKRVAAQHVEIEQLNKIMAPFRILKGTEVDILPNGALDYDDLTLTGFDFVIASVHSHFFMDQDKMTGRLLRAIANPFTNILGHVTGRLLLAREGYEIDHKAIIQACAENGVMIELNASPHRLDLDWTWISYAVECGVMIAVNPNAHRKEALMDVRWGVAAARKGMLSRKWTLNALNRDEIEEIFLHKKKQRIA